MLLVLYLRIPPGGAHHENRDLRRQRADRPAADRPGARRRPSRGRWAATAGGCDAVLSSLGVPFGRQPITAYSGGVVNIISAMHEHELKRLVVVSSSATYPHHHADGGFLLNRVLQPIVTRTIGKTTYADMRRMEELVRA